jgi:5'-deoxynucleotidase YfbR-like HD superfamily hydrolase
MTEHRKVDPQNLLDLWGSGFVNRWHTHPHPGLRNSQDLTGAHTWRVMILVTMLSCDKVAATTEGLLYDVMSAMFHDCPEVDTGDVSHPFKRANPAIVTALDKYDAEWFESKNVPVFKLTPIVHLADRLDSYLYMLQHAPDLRNKKKWKELETSIAEAAYDLQCLELVREVMNKAKKREWF